MKYYHGQLEERNGEQEYSYDYLIKAKSFVEAQARLELEASEFYGESEKSGEGYEFCGGALYVEVNCLSETTVKQFHKNMEVKMFITA